MRSQEHDLEHIVERGTKVNYICTGAGKECCYEDTNLDTVPQDSIKFTVCRNCRVLVALLCSYDNVGVAALQLRPSTGPVKEVNLKWRTGSSQQCVIDAGFTALQGDELSDPFIEVRVGSFALNVQANVSGTGSSREEGAAFQRKHNQVKVYGIYEQEQ